MDKKIVGKIQAVLKRHNVKKAALFGSFARGEEREKSDVDILIEPPDKFTLFDMAGMKTEIEASIRRQVDLVTFRSISPLLKPYITKDVKMIT
ncbi:hypothetical protein AUJ17_04425 [Candidatus Micrarchaeota archaeon CG1_02_47_40]|nr:MAG: hypothetical protein AUJ17_04425 [Candidatus Micrarchaeota archaeon CG1_02_47_40]